MRSKALDAEVVLKNNCIFIPNTEFEIYVDWSLSILDHDDCAEVKVSLEKIFGKFAYKDSREGFKRRVEVEFECSGEWSMTPIDRGRLTEWVDTIKDTKVYPTLVKLDFDTKKAKVFF